MNQETRQRRRIVVTIDSGDLDASELERLSRLAHRLDAELEGVFVEDSDLLRLSGLAFVREYRPISRRTESFEAERMQQELRAVARRAERTLARFAQQRGVSWSFRVWRGSLERELLSAVQADVLALMGVGAVMPSTRKRGRQVISAWFDGSGEAARALDTAANIAADSDSITLEVLLATDGGDSAEELRTQAARVLSDYKGDVTFRALDNTGLHELLRVLRESGSSALVMQRDNRLLCNTSLRQSLSYLHCPLFLVS
ncbi:MAG TPA: hypothetical protein VK973_02480 [Arenicellales bacterium]|nr:hypothetical protein [Arenicellales bacterium]